MYPVLSTTIPFAVRSNQEGINKCRPLIDHIIFTYITWITDIWTSDLESPDGGFCGGASFSVKGLATATTVCSSVCVGEGATFFYVCFCSSLEACLEACLGIFTGLKRQTRMRTSLNVPSFYRSDLDVRADRI